MGIDKKSSQKYEVLTFLGKKSSDHPHNCECYECCFCSEIEVNYQFSNIENLNYSQFTNEMSKKNN